MHFSEQTEENKNKI